VKAKYVYYDKKRPALKGNMTRKDYKLIAQELRRIQYKYVELSAQTKNIIDDLRVGLAIELAKENPRFNHYKFNKACGGGE
jgi:hypothetical protein